MELQICDINACGTVNKNRIGLSPEIQEEITALGNEKAIFYTHGNILLCVWRTHKGKEVYLLSTLHNNSMQVSKRYCTKEKKYIDILKPKILESYNQHMRGVDFFDQQIRYYSFLHGSKKWYKKIASYFLEVAVLNSYVVYQECFGTESLNRKNYIQAIIKSLLDIEEIEKISPISIDRKKQCNLQLHDRNPIDCEMCSSQSVDNKNRKRTQYFCRTCNVFVCIINCYDRHRVEKEMKGT